MAASQLRGAVVCRLVAKGPTAQPAAFSFGGCSLRVASTCLGLHAPGPVLVARLPWAAVAGITAVPGSPTGLTVALAPGSLPHIASDVVCAPALHATPRTLHGPRAVVAAVAALQLAFPTAAERDRALTHMVATWHYATQGSAVEQPPQAAFDVLPPPPSAVSDSIQYHIQHPGSAGSPAYSNTRWAHNDSSPAMGPPSDAPPWRSESMPRPDAVSLTPNPPPTVNVSGEVPGDDGRTLATSVRSARDRAAALLDDVRRLRGSRPPEVLTAPPDDVQQSALLLESERRRADLLAAELANERGAANARRLQAVASDETAARSVLELKCSTAAAELAGDHRALGYLACRTPAQPARASGPQTWARLSVADAQCGPSRPEDLLDEGRPGGRDPAPDLRGPETAGPCDVAPFQATTTASPAPTSLAPPGTGTVCDVDVGGAPVRPTIVSVGGASELLTVVDAPVVQPRGSITVIAQGSGGEAASEESLGSSVGSVPRSEAGQPQGSVSDALATSPREADRTPARSSEADTESSISKASPVLSALPAVADSAPVETTPTTDSLARSRSPSGAVSPTPTPASDSNTRDPGASMPCLRLQPRPQLQPCPHCRRPAPASHAPRCAHRAVKCRKCGVRVFARDAVSHECA